MRYTAMAVVLAAIGLAACTGQPESPSASFSVGAAGASYSLASVDGQAVPATAYFGVDVSVRATGGKLTLGEDHSYSLSVAYDRHFASGNRDTSFTLTEQGTWSASGNELTLTPANGSAHKALVAGSRVSLALTVPDSSPPERATKTYTFTKTP